MMVIPFIAVVDVSNGYYFTLPIYAVTYVISCTEQVLVRRRVYEPAKFMVYLLYLAVTIFFIVIIGQIFNFFILVLYAMIPILIFEHKPTGYLLVLLVLLCYPVMFSVMQHVHPLILLKAQMVSFYMVTGAFFITVIIFLISMYSRSINDSYEQQILLEKQRSEELLLNILPAEVAEELKEKGAAQARLFNDVTVLFTDFVGFTKIAERLTPNELVDELHYCFRHFDAIVGKYGIEKIKTIGDAYMAVAGLPAPDAEHALHIVQAGLEIRDFMVRRKAEMGDRTFNVRVGVNSGSVVAGIVGVKKFAFDIWGDAVNTAARMEQNSEGGKVNLSEATYLMVKEQFECTYRGEITAKNKGALKMYYAEPLR
jgi:class 3 adenylate cyclase